VPVQEGRWDEGGGSQQPIIYFTYGNGNTNHHLGTGFFVHMAITSAIKRVEFISGRMSYITIRSHWCDTVPHMPCTNWA